MGSLNLNPTKMKSLLLVAVVGLVVTGVTCWPTTTLRKQCRFTESISLFEAASTREVDQLKEELLFAAEFSRFMNHRMPLLLQEFADRKKIYDIRRKVDTFKGRTKRSPLDKRDMYKIDYMRQAAEDTEVVEATDNTEEVAEEVAEDVTEDVTEEVADDVTEEVAEDVMEDVEGDDTEDTEANSEEDEEEEQDDDNDNDDDNDDDDNDDDDNDDDDNGDDDNDDDDNDDDGNDDNAIEEIGEAAADLATDIVDVVVNSGTNIVDLFEEIVGSVGEVLEDVVPASAWTYMCMATWYPLHADHCARARCVACAPAITSATSVCQRSGQGPSHRCIQTVMGEGFCNFCINDYLLI